MNKKIISGVITEDSLNVWFNSLDWNSKLSVNCFLPFDCDKILFEQIAVGEFENGDVDGVLYAWNNCEEDRCENVLSEKLCKYLVFNKLYDKKTKYSFVSLSERFIFSSTKEMVQVLNVDKNFRWKSDCLIERFNNLDNEKKAEINNLLLSLCF